MHKTADTRWKQLWRAGALGAASLKRLTGGAVASPVPQLMAKRVVNAEMAPKLFLGGQHMLKSHGVFAPRLQKPSPDDMLRSSLDQLQAKSQLNTDGAINFGELFRNRAKATLNNGKTVIVPTRINPADANHSHVWSGSHDASYLPQLDVVKMPRTKAVNGLNLPEDTKRLIKDQILATGKHEFGHRWTYQHPNVGGNYASAILRHLGLSGYKSTIPEVDSSTLASEAAGHFRATLHPEVNRAAKLAIDLPIEKFKELHPEKWRVLTQQLAHYPEALRKRLMATRAHLATNYLVN